MTSRAACCLPLMVFFACGPRQTPLPRTPGQPAPITILGESYTVPARLDVPHFSAEPGQAHLVFQDNVTRCEGDVLFVTVGELAPHDEFVLQLTNERVRSIAKAGITYERSESKQQVWSREARVVTFELSDHQDTARHVIWDVHSAQQQLSAVGEILCMDASLMDGELKAVVAFVNTASFAEASGTDPEADAPAEQTAAAAAP